ncbi:MAG: hypothetical protein M5U26_24815 [Planctomycetota bacterium]|nr:hypothetical protein [Planctomycetota bacterium]
MKAHVCVLVALLTTVGVVPSSLAAGSENTGRLMQPPTEEVWRGLDAPGLAYHLMRTYMTEAQWKAEVTYWEKRYKDWESDNRGDMGRFLNDRLIIVALSAAGARSRRSSAASRTSRCIMNFASSPRPSC